MNVLGCVAAFIAMLLAYLASPNQRALSRPLGRMAVLGAWALAVTALAAWVSGETTLPGIFSALTALMLGAVAFPYVVWWARPAHRKSR